LQGVTSLLIRPPIPAPLPLFSIDTLRPVGTAVRSHPAPLPNTGAKKISRRSSDQPTHPVHGLRQYRIMPYYLVA